MKITETNNNINLAALKRKKGQQAEGGFAELMEADESSSSEGLEQISPSAPVGSVFAADSLNILNNLNDSEYSKQENLNYGKDIIEQLEQMRNQMLLGTVSETTLHNINQRLNNLPVQAEDKMLSELVEEIKTRAEVELAKIEIRKQKDIL